MVTGTNTGYSAGIGSFNFGYNTSLNSDGQVETETYQFGFNFLDKSFLGEKAGKASFGYEKTEGFNLIQF